MPRKPDTRRKRRKTRPNVPARGRKPKAADKMPTAEPSLPTDEKGHLDIVDLDASDLCSLDLADEQFPYFLALEDRQKLFVLYYIEFGCNGAKAARKLGYEGGAAKTKAWALKRMPGVREAIEEFIQQAGLAPTEIIALLASIATEDEDSSARLRALKLLAQMQGMLVEKKEHTHKVRDLGTTEDALIDAIEEEVAQESGVG